jgi:hypothetical protein
VLCSGAMEGSAGSSMRGDARQAPSEPPEESDLALHHLEVVAVALFHDRPLPS